MARQLRPSCAHNIYVPRRSLKAKQQAEVVAGEHYSQPMQARKVVVEVVQRHWPLEQATEFVHNRPEHSKPHTAAAAW